MHLSPFLCFREQNWGQLCAYSRSLGMSFELLTATIGSRASLLLCPHHSIENALRSEKLGQNRGKSHQILTPNESVLTFWAPTSVQNFIEIEQKLRL